MSESNGRGETDAVRRRRIRFRAWHRGMREVDLLLGGFADAHLDDLDEDQLAAFEVLLDVPDPVVLAWVIGEEDVPAAADSALIRRLIDFHAGQGAGDET
ncbi:MAG: succinate dehydrogenase assembly factor 2 [Bauldia sp.]